MGNNNSSIQQRNERLPSPSSEPHSAFFLTSTYAPQLPSRKERILKRLSKNVVVEPISSDLIDDDAPPQQARALFSNELEIVPDNMFTVLLVGCGASGKTTIFKQSAVLYDDRMYHDQSYLQEWKNIVRGNCLKALSILVSLCQEGEDIHVLPYNVEIAKRIAKLGDDSYLRMQKIWSETLASDMLTMWNDPNIQQAYHEKRHLSQIPENTGYNFDYFETIRQNDYVPSDVDIIMNTYKTTGYVSKTFLVNDSLAVKLLDTGGQRNERKKWKRIYDFERIDFVLYVVALSEYNEVLYEDEVTNRLEESLQLFSTILEEKKIRHVPLILVLNKVDLFQRKLEELNDLANYFPQYTGGKDVRQGVDFIKQMFTNQIASDRQVFVFETNASKTDNIEAMFKNLLK